MENNTVDKGNFLENIVAKLCAELMNGKVQKNIKIKGRQIDTLITGRMGPIDVKINVEVKNYGKPVGVGEVDAIIGKIQSLDIDIGVLVSVSGFTKGARTAAGKGGIQLLEPFSPELENQLLVPIGIIIPTLDKFSYTFSVSSRNGEFRMPFDLSRIRVKTGKKNYDIKQLAQHIWNIPGMIPRKAGSYEIPLNAASIADRDIPDDHHYCDLTLHVTVIEEYFLKISPVSGLRNATIGKEAYEYCATIDMDNFDTTKWKRYGSLNELNDAQKMIPNQPPNIKNWKMTLNYQIKIENTTDSTFFQK